MEYVYRRPSPLGGITLTGTETALTGLWFDGQRYFPARAAGLEARPLPVFDAADRWLSVFFSGRAPDFTPPLVLNSTPFQRAVWDLLLTIPFGQTVTYGEIAAALGTSPRAAGGAVGRNPLSLIVPCHRVVGADGRLTGYAGGLDRKARLLAMERSGRR